MLYTGKLHITFHAERDGDRKRFFKLVEDAHLGNPLMNPQQLQKFVYKFSIYIHKEDPQDIVCFLKENGVFVLNAKWDNGSWRHKKYTNPYPAGDMTTKKYRACVRKKNPKCSPEKRAAQ